MGQSPRNKNRRIKIPETEREYWRRVFFDEVHGRARVKNIIEQDLRPLWHQTGHELQSLAVQDRISVMEQIWSADKLLPSQIEYGDQVKQVTRDTLRCRQDGQAAAWVAAYVSAAVQDRLPDGPFLPDPEEELPQRPCDRSVLDVITVWPNGEPSPLFEIQLTLQVGPYGSNIMVDLLDVSSNRPLFRSVDRPFPDNTGRWDDWETFAANAHSALSACLSLVREDYERRNPMQANVKSDQDRLQDAKNLAEYLVDRKPLVKDAKNVQRLRRFAASVGLDYPVK